ncbi:hypothetical protein pb186bvf_014330 [Paramecium bursaria]
MKSQSIDYVQQAFFYSVIQLQIYQLPINQNLVVKISQISSYLKIQNNIDTKISSYLDKKQVSNQSNFIDTKISSYLDEKQVSNQSNLINLKPPYNIQFIIFLKKIIKILEQVSSLNELQHYQQLLFIQNQFHYYLFQIIQISSFAYNMGSTQPWEKLRFDINHFNNIVKKVQNRSEGWNNQLLSQFKCQFVNHQDYISDVVCIHRTCKQHSRRLCLLCAFEHIHSTDIDYSEEYLILEPQVFSIIEEYRSIIKKEFEFIDFSLVIFALELCMEDRYFFKKQAGIVSDAIKAKYQLNMTIENYVNELHSNKSLFEFLSENFLQLFKYHPVLKPYSDVKQKLIKTQRNNILQNIANQEVDHEQDHFQKKNMLDLLKEVFESQVYRENLVSKEDRQVIDRSVETVLQYSLEQLYSDKVQDAIEICDTVKENCNTNIQELINKDMCFDKQCKYQEALQMFDQAIQLNPNNYESHFRIKQLGITFNHMQVYQQAIEQYKVALQLQPLSYQIHSKLANVYIKMNQYEECMNNLWQFKKKINKNKLKYQRINAYQKIGKIMMAQEKIPLLRDFNHQTNNQCQLLYLFRIEKNSFDKAIKMYPEFPLAYQKKQQFIINLKKTYQEDKLNIIMQNIDWIENQKYDEIMKKFNHFKLKGRVLFQFKDYRKSINQLKLAIQLEPKDSEIYFLQECVNYHILKQDQDLKMVDKAAQYDPQNPQYQIQKGNLHIQHKEYELAKLCYEKANEIDSQLFESWCSRIFCDFKLQSNFDGSQQFKEIIKSSIQQFDRVRVFGICIQNLGQFFISIQELNWALMIYECLYDTIRDDVNIKNIISINLFQQVQLKSKLNIDDS